MDDHTHTDILIVGAGMAGLMAAHSLVQQHINVLLVEKKARVGLLTRLTADVFSHGLSGVGGFIPAWRFLLGYRRQ